VNGPPILLLHGQPGAARDWDAVIAALGDHVQAIAFDRPGWDRRRPPGGLADNARAALSELDARGLGRATIVGHSLGAAIAVWLAAQAPERVSALVLAAPAANMASVERFDRWLALPVVGPLTGAASLAGLGLALRAGPVRRRIARRSGLPDPYLQASGRALTTAWAWRAFATEQHALMRDLPRLEHRLGEIRAPTWILTGTGDRVLPATAPRTLARQIPGAQLRELPGAGHLLPQLHARELADGIRLALSAAGTG
jgi:pimeloyl-ACP methyl ester carboxylesterase